MVDAYTVLSQLTSYKGIEFSEEEIDYLVTLVEEDIAND